MARFLQATILIVLVASSVTSVFGSPLVENNLVARQVDRNIIYIEDADRFCMIMPRLPNINIDNSKYPGVAQTYCSPAARKSPEQGEFPPYFWSNIEFSAGENYVQLTGCIRPESFNRLNPSDKGGQSDSSGGPRGLGEPVGSTCLGFNHYIELVEPRSRRACIRCCDNPQDCPTDLARAGCPVVIPGNYFDCGYNNRWTHRDRLKPY
ncbi:hypothetical protein BDM02DRAFT_3101901 [Thelephora ganbajun]|uniref:Uncharacterized protein n=1 Tax=Thelephora ganbajun TaxID=370292 RepID=A0ACB6Z638_THEGA|nr:hypothetical protein BDM02DRAFT_3101901 [Thelephora ganbajun]